ncbi:MAG: DUF411 domain-containing protein, partial [Leptospirales bacterium]
EEPGLSIDSAADMVVYKTPTCGCCGKWVEHMRDAGYSVEVREQESLNDVKQRYKIPGEMQSCHTAVIDGYFVEGHVPAKVLKRFLKEAPAGARGLAVPGMPIGSPGMEVGDRQDPYDVLVLKQSNAASVYATEP